jgi:hypothetical protein
VDQTRVIDIISISKQTGEVELTISDHLDWSDNEHLLLLQEKLNAYLAFVESGEIYDQYPKAKGREIVFEIIFVFKPSPIANEFLERAQETVQSAGFKLRHRMLIESHESIQ